MTRTWYKREGAFATSGLEMALWDIKSKTCGVPLYELLGGSFRTRVPYSGYLFINTPEENAQKAREYVRQGYTTLKLKVGRDIEQDLEMLNQLRKEVGHRIHIRVDANQAWLVSEAIRNIRKMEKFNISNVEQPVAFDDIDGMYEIRRSVETPIVADESCFTIDDAMQLANRRAADILLIRIEEAGGIINTKKILGIAEAAKMPCIMGTWNESELNTMAKVAVIASSKNFPYANDTVLPFFDAGLSQEGLDLTRPYIDVSEKPGLGVTLSESALKRYSVFR